MRQPKLDPNNQNHIIVEYFNEEDEEIELSLPFEWQICDNCRGKGTQDNPAFSNGITEDEWNNDWGEEEREYYLAGMYDVSCENGCCDGKVRVPITETEEEKTAWNQFVESQLPSPEEISERRYFAMFER